MACLEERNISIPSQRWFDCLHKKIQEIYGKKKKNLLERTQVYKDQSIQNQYEKVIKLSIFLMEYLGIFTGSSIRFMW